ncbi:MAG: 50S ribosomal protein L29 [bacterium]
MAKKTKPTFKDTPTAELTKLRGEKREELRVLRFASAGSRPKDTNEPKAARKVIARIETELSKRRIAAK